MNLSGLVHQRALTLLCGLAILLAGGAGAASAAVTATGSFSPDPLVDGDLVQIGINGYGTLRIDEGSVFTSSQVTLGLSEFGFGVATVTDAGSRWTFDSGNVGANGLGRLEIRQGGVVEVTTGSGLRLGSNSSGHGTVVVADPGSLLQVDGQLTIGQSDVGVLEIGPDAIVNIPGGTTQVWGNGRIELSGGFLRANDFENRGLVTGSGEISIQCCGQVDNFGRMEVGEGDHLLVTNIQSNSLINRGELVADGGELEIYHLLTNESSGETRGQITLRNGTLRAGVVGGTSQFQPQLRNRGLVTVIGGENHVYGTVGNEFEGQIAVTNNSLVMFHQDVESDNNTTISVFAGSTAIFLQDLHLNGGATLLADLAGVTGFGHVEVVGDLFVNGVLQVSLSNGYAPQLGDSFPLVTAAGGISGQLMLSDMPPLADDLDWRLEVGANQVVLSVVTPTLPGDYNGNGTVDAADYTTWRDMLGQAGSGLAADGAGPTGNPDGIVNYLDYDFWKANFGNTASSGADAHLAPGDSPGANYAVPEPTACALALLGLAIVVGQRAMSRG